MKLILTILTILLFQRPELLIPEYEVTLNNRIIPDSLVSVEFNPVLSDSCQYDYHEITIYLSGNDTIEIINVPCEYIIRSKIILINILDKKSCEARMSVNDEGAVYWVGKRDAEVWRRAKNSILFILP